MYSKTALLSVFAAVMLPQLAQGHGYIKSPAARNYSPNDGFYDDQAGNGAGSPIRFNANPGICGDPFQGHTSTNFAGTVGPIRGEALCKST
jgi:predicted carbohydrate-binding protein with CBM5 and CBM33 domain